MRDRLLLVMAWREGRWIAGAINFIGSGPLSRTQLRAIEHHPFLHFEVCYYQAIGYAISNGLQWVEAGAQGRRKIARGYLPQTTYSARYIPDPGFRRAVRDYLKHERAHVAEAVRELTDAGPFRKVHRRRLNGLADSGPAATVADLLRARSARPRRSRQVQSEEVKMTTYDPTNIFAKILRGEIPCCKVYEDDHTLAFLDIMPRSPGHVLVIPEIPGPQYSRHFG